MGFSPKQQADLEAPLSRGAVKTREQSGRTLSFVEAWYAIDTANRIFGFDGWSSETTETRCVVEKDRLVGKKLEPGFSVTYTAKVRIGVYFDDGSNVYRDGCGAGHGIDRDLGQAHESALKEAESDARKRALMTLGYQFGLALYDKQQANVADEPEEDSREQYIDECRRKIAGFPDNSTLALTWWNDPINHRARNDMLLPPDRLELQALVKAKLPTKETNDQTREGRSVV